MKYRQKMPKKQSKANFRKGSKVKAKNLRAAPMRGGWRL